MNRVTDIAEDCNRNLPANPQNNVAFNKSVSEGNVLVSSGAVEEDKTLMLSRELATFINSKQPDLTASLIIYGLYTWQISKRNPFGYNPKINGRLCAYRSLRELEEDYPWLRHNSVLKAIQRSAAKLKADFIMQVVKRNGQKYLHFLLSDSLIKTYKFDLSERHTKSGRDGNIISKDWKRRKAGLISFQRSDAIKHGMMGAILLTNLEHVLDPEHNTKPLVDDAGNIYRELSPTALTKPAKEINGEKKPPLPVSGDTITRELNHLKSSGVLHEHPLQNNFYTLVSTMKPWKGNAAEVTTTAAEVTTHAAEVTTKSVVMERKAYDDSNLRCKIETPDRNRDCKEDGKCLTQLISSLRSDINCDEFEMSPGAKKLNDIINEGLAAFRQRDKTSIPKFDVCDHAVYRVDDYDRVSIIGYEFDHEFVKVDWHTGKPYTRELEVDNYVKECETLFCLQRLPYTSEDEKALRDIFEQNLWFTPDIVNHLICHDYINGILTKPKKRHDFDFFARKLTSVKYFLRYLPQLLREKHLNAQKRVEWDHHPVTGAPMFDYSEMEPPMMRMAFADGKTPVTWFYVPLLEERPEVGCYYEGGKTHEFLTGDTIMVKTKRVKSIFYDEFTSAQYEPVAYEVTHKPGFRRYEEFLSLPSFWEDSPEPRDFSSVAIRDWKHKHGNPKLL